MRRDGVRGCARRPGARSWGVRRREAEGLANTLLTAFWIVPPGRNGPLGFGVTAHSLDDALLIIRAAGYGGDLPENLSSLKIIEGVQFADVEHPYVREHMGPIVVRGLWYPFVRVGT